MNPLVTALAPTLMSIVEKAIPDPQAAEKIKSAMAIAMIDKSSELTNAAASVVNAEIQGESWLQRNWRPMLMVWFALLIGGYWFGFVPNNMPLPVVQDLFQLVQIGVGGYVGGRTVEKVASTLAPVLGRS
jgi:FtsH-binding integral membrane protein